MWLRLPTFLFASALAGSQLVRGDDAPPFADVVRPLLETKCVSCHGPEKQEGGLRLDSPAAARAGGDRGAAIVPGDAERSLLVEAVRFANPDLQMPPKQKLSDQEINALTNWVKQGAEWSEPDAPPSGALATEQPAGDAFTDPRNPIRKLFHGERLDLWSLRKPIAREVPQGFNSSANPIDAFLRERLASAKLSLSSESDRRTLIRRLTFDLLGLPPTAAEVEAFLADEADDAYEKLVTRLLDSPHYGERQARMWLDVVRYADTHGYERDEFRPLAWQYRDYVIRSFNQDKPFDQFIREQLAGDELIDGPPRTADEADMLIATGYLRLGQWDSTATIFQEEDRLRADMLADLTNTTAAALLGLTMSCCQCHDHKFDPLSQADHYRLRAFFAGLKLCDDLVIDTAEVQREIELHNAPLDRAIETLKQELPAAEKADETRHEEVQKQIAELEAKKRKPRVAMAATDEGPEPPATHVFYQGDFHAPREVVDPGFVSILTPGPARVQPSREQSSGRRLALANWIASADNRWTARVLVNRVWQQHFGVGLVATPNDFGYSGARPTHPALLDWLAIEFVRSGWSVKQLHRLIVTADAYRQTSTNNASGSEVDPENKLLWRQNIQRLDAETLRDSLLAVSGLLRPYDSGRPMWPSVPAEQRLAQPAILEAEKGGDGGRMQGWYTDPLEQTDVRSVFLIRKRCLPIPFLQVFDFPDSIVSCARRDTTVVAPQALMLLNSADAVRFAEALTDRVADATGKPSDEFATRVPRIVESAFRIALQRQPDEDELKLASEFLAEHTEKHRAGNAGDGAERLAVIDFCRAILNLNEFTYVD